MREANINFANIDARDLSLLVRCIMILNQQKIVHLAAISSAVTANNNPSLAYDIQINSLRKYNRFM